MVDAIHEGKLKSLYLMGEEMAVVDSTPTCCGGFSKLDFFVVQEFSSA